MPLARLQATGAAVVLDASALLFYEVEVAAWADRHHLPSAAVAWAQAGR